MWAMLNDLSSNKPLEYDEFIKQQFEEAKKEEEARKGIIQDFAKILHVLLTS